MYRYRCTAPVNERLFSDRAWSDNPSLQVDSPPQPQLPSPPLPVSLSQLNSSHLSVACTENVRCCPLLSATLLLKSKTLDSHQRFEIVALQSADCILYWTLSVFYVAAKATYIRLLLWQNGGFSALAP